ncbi:hypothetical protein [Rhizobium sp. BK376]|uniref:hypothetical protein n=1 Tax=Rhizobium sp. BK376 TaxID=2512149 RepID=UPI00104D6063|nr:hypothetical protein [Rhizobium sp. BK376]TCR92832.1 hypothetical protein EV561_101273 [Rhizobium sp. BK376]
MRNLIPAILLSLLTGGVAAAEDIAPERIIDAATGDWDKDGKTDMAMLVGPKEQGDDIAIYIYLRDKDHDLLKLVTTAPAKVWGNASLDGMFGQDPSIKGMPNGSIAVHSENSGVGRDRWDQTLTLAYRNGAFIVAGYTYNYYDTLDPDHNGSCDYNVLTGKVTKDGKDTKAEPKTIKIEDWDDQVGQTGCGIKQD